MVRKYLVEVAIGGPEYVGIVVGRENSRFVGALVDYALGTRAREKGLSFAASRPAASTH